MEIKFNDFNVDWIQRIDSNVEHAFAIKLVNDNLTELGDNLGLEFHYEIHFNKNSAFVRFDCHCKPYGEFSNLSKDVYFDKVGEQRLIKREELKKQVKKSFSCYKLKRYQYNYLCLLKKEIALNNIKKETEIFIGETYDNLIKIIKNIK